MPTAAALAAATITAQLQAKDVETNSQPTVVGEFSRNQNWIEGFFLGGFTNYE